MSVELTCRVCGMLAVYNYDRNYKQVTSMAIRHKREHSTPERKHHVNVRRSES